LFPVPGADDIGRVANGLLQSGFIASISRPADGVVEAEELGQGWKGRGCELDCFCHNMIRTQ
jgi:hypothetical protein